MLMQEMSFEELLEHYDKTLNDYNKYMKLSRTAGDILSVNLEKQAKLTESFADFLCKNNLVPAQIDNAKNIYQDNMNAYIQKYETTMKTVERLDEIITDIKNGLHDITEELRDRCQEKTKDRGFEIER